MNDRQATRLSDTEAREFFERLFPYGVAGPDVLADIAPDGWEKSPLVACFHPSAEQVFEEQLAMHRNVERFVSARRTCKPDNPERLLREPTLAEVRADWRETVVQATEEVTELVGQCLWDLFSDNHDVIAADGRVLDIGSFRGASAFLDEYLSGAEYPSDSADAWRRGDSMRFYMGTIWTADRADLTTVYRMIFARLEAMGAHWQYHFPELLLVDLSPSRDRLETTPAGVRGVDDEGHERDAEIARLRADLAEAHGHALRDAIDRPPPATVSAYRDVFGRNPKGWPPVISRSGQAAVGD